MRAEQKSCSCDTCKSMCDRPCWPTPADAQRIISAGLGNRLMLDVWLGDERSNHESIEILSPAVKGYEGQTSPFWPTGGCTFQNIDGLCELHTLGLKPTEGRISWHGYTGQQLHWRMAKSWWNEKAQTLVKSWKMAANIATENTNV